MEATYAISRRPVHCEGIFGKKIAKSGFPSENHPNVAMSRNISICPSISMLELLYVRMHCCFYLCESGHSQKITCVYSCRERDP